MSRKINHQFLGKMLTALGNVFEERTFEIKINRVGALSISAKLVYKRFKQNEQAVNLETELIAPDGIPFTRSNITLADLDKYRDLRGFVKPWKLKVKSHSVSPIIDYGDNKPLGAILAVAAKFELHVLENITTSSAAAVLSISRNDNRTTISTASAHKIDLYRLGELRITAFPPPGITISLIRPDGTIMAAGINGILTVGIDQSDVKWSRDSAGKKILWTLRFEGISTRKMKYYAQVYDTLKIPAAVITERISALFGQNGENIAINVNWNKNLLTNVFTVQPKTDRLAETLEMHSVIPDTNSVKKDVSYKIYDNPMVLEENGPGPVGKIQAKCNDLSKDSFSFNIGKSVTRRAIKCNSTYTSISQGEVMIPADLPKISITASFKNTIRLIIDNWENGELIIPNLIFEMALDVKDGNIIARCWLDPNSLKYGGEEANPHIPLYNDTYYLMQKISNAIDSKFNDKVTAIVQNIFDRMMGGVFTFTASKWDSGQNAMEFEYITDNLPEMEQNPNYRSFYNPALGPDIPSKIDTWHSVNLTNPDNIKHIVVLMMENRSFDHVLGHLSLPQTGSRSGSQPPINAAVDGLTSDIIRDFSVDGNEIRHLKNARFDSNTASLKTKLPVGVGHSLEDVKEQLGANNYMKGFVNNFKKVNTAAKLAENKVDPQDVLGYYTGEELEMFKYLASEYAICDNYFSSHPGPTLPNRMYSLKGGLQKDRNGEPRLNNSVDSTFFLSRDQTIFDILSQQGVSWRVYESLPSVSMLRMFTRYVGENDKIRNITKLEEDINHSIEHSDFPSVVFIDPAMHDGPANDDHPPADMLHGQYLIKKVYDALKKGNNEIWKHTLFVITYDEHGGLFDHVAPKIVESYKKTTGTSVSASSATRLTRSISDQEDVILGLRVPTFLISPYVKKGSVIKTRLDHTSILKSILVRFCNEKRPFLSDRVKYANHFGPALTDEYRTVATQSPILASFSNVRRPTSLVKVDKFLPTTKEKLSNDDADFHEFMSFLSRTVK